MASRKYFLFLFYENCWDNKSESEQVDPMFSVPIPRMGLARQGYERPGAVSGGENGYLFTPMMLFC